MWFSRSAHEFGTPPPGDEVFDRETVLVFRDFSESRTLFVEVHDTRVPARQYNINFCVLPMTRYYRTLKLNRVLGILLFRMYKLSLQPNQLRGSTGVEIFLTLILRPRSTVVYSSRILLRDRYFQLRLNILSPFPLLLPDSTTI